MYNWLYLLHFSVLGKPNRKTIYLYDFSHARLGAIVWIETFYPNHSYITAATAKMKELITSFQLRKMKDNLSFIWNVCLISLEKRNVSRWHVYQICENASQTVSHLLKMKFRFATSLRLITTFKDYFHHQPDS